VSEEDLIELKELQDMAEGSWLLGSSNHRRVTLGEISHRLTELIRKHEGAPKDCSGDPSSCPDNEGCGCHCTPRQSC
jgi:hypothetical protein